jgi:hypothetical protein
MFRRILYRFLYAIAVVSVIIFVCWPTVDAYVIHREVVSALEQSQSARLEEFSGTNILTTLELSKEERRQITSALPITPDVGAPFLMSLCFVPHHRVIITDREGTNFVLTVCFQCDQVETDTLGILSTPYLWRASIRDLFSSHGIPIRDSHEYGHILWNNAKGI